MTNFRMIVTNDGKHPASKWADVAVDDIMEISASAPAGLMREAKILRQKLMDIFTHHHQRAMDHEQAEIAAGRHTDAHPYVTEDHATEVVQHVAAAAKGTSFESHFAQSHVQQHVEHVCNHFFKSAKHVERQHFFASQTREDAKKPKKS